MLLGCFRVHGKTENVFSFELCQICVKFVSNLCQICVKPCQTPNPAVPGKEKHKLSPPNRAISVCNAMCFCNPPKESRDFGALDGTKSQGPVDGGGVQTRGGFPDLDLSVLLRPFLSFV